MNALYFTLKYDLTLLVLYFILSQDIHAAKVPEAVVEEVSYSKVVSFTS